MRDADSAMIEKIQLMIEAEADPRERTRLMILLEITRVLIDNVKATREMIEKFTTHRDEFDKHVEIEQQMIAQGRGMWRVAAIVIVITQGFLGYIVTDHFAEMKALSHQVATHTKMIEVINERHRQEERFNRSIP